MIPFWQRKIGGAGNALELVIDMQGRKTLGYMINSQDDAVHTIAVSGDGVAFYTVKTITFNESGVQQVQDQEEIPWRYARIKTEIVGDHVYEASAK